MVLRSSYYFSGQVLPLRSDWDSTTGVDLADTIIDLLVKTGVNMSPRGGYGGFGTCELDNFVSNLLQVRVRPSLFVYFSEIVTCTQSACENQ